MLATGHDSLGLLLQIADEGFDGVHQENVILENLKPEQILGKLSEEEAKAGAVTDTFTPPPIDSILNLYDLEQVLLLRFVLFIVLHLCRCDGRMHSSLCHRWKCFSGCRWHMQA